METEKFKRLYKVRPEHSRYPILRRYLEAKAAWSFNPYPPDEPLEKTLFVFFENPIYLPKNHLLFSQMGPEAALRLVETYRHRPTIFVHHKGWESLWEEMAKVVELPHVIFEPETLIQAEIGRAKAIFLECCNQFGMTTEQCLSSRKTLNVLCRSVFCRVCKEMSIPPDIAMSAMGMERSTFYHLSENLASRFPQFEWRKKLENVKNIFL